MVRFSYKFLFNLFVLYGLLYNHVIAQSGVQVSQNDNYTGFYKLISLSPVNNGYIEIKYLSNKMVKFHIWVVRNGHIAETDGTFNVDENKGIFDNRKYNASNCLLIFNFMKDTLKLNQKGRTGECGFGYLANVSGFYKKVNSKDPTFKNLKKHNQVDDDVYKKKIIEIDKRQEMIKKMLDNSPINVISKTKISISDSLTYNRYSYDSFLNHTFRNDEYKKSASRLLAPVLNHDSISKYRDKLLRDDNFKSFSKQWVALAKTNNGYVIADKKNDKASIEIFDNSIIINSFYGMFAIPIKKFNRKDLNTYIIYPAFLKDSIGIYKFEIINSETRMARVSVKLISRSFKVVYFNCVMIPINSISQFSLSE